MTMTLSERFVALPAVGIEDELQLEPGSMRDYAELSEHHYRAKRPATVTRILVLRHHRSTVSDRFIGRASQSVVVAVLLESLPALNCRLRDYALCDRYGGWRSASDRARILNAELRCISRVIVHPQWRGLGLAVRLVRSALDDPHTIFTEALAAMGKVHPFFERAGMLAYHRPPHIYDDRLVVALSHCGFDALDLATLGLLLQRVDQLPEAQRTWLLTELHRWYRRTLGRSNRHSADPAEHLRAARQRLLCEPVYFLKDNRLMKGDDT